MTYEELRERVARETWEHVEGENSWARAGTGDKFNHRGFTDLTIRAVIEALAQEADAANLIVACPAGHGWDIVPEFNDIKETMVADWLRAHVHEVQR